MLSLDPSQRLSASEHMQNSAFPPYFNDLHELLTDLNEIGVESFPLQINLPTKNVLSTLSVKPPGALNPAILPETTFRPDPIARTDGDDRIEFIVQQWNAITSLLGKAEYLNDLLQDTPLLSKSVCVPICAPRFSETHSMAYCKVILSITSWIHP